MRLTTVEELRELRGKRAPLYAVRWLAYLDSPNDRPKPGYGYGSDEDIFTSPEEARARFAELAQPSALVEEASLHEARYSPGGGCSWWTIDQYKDQPQ